MKTIRLYDEDSYISEFEATVISVKEENGKFKTVLDKTAFFPEAGGQPCDKGTINENEVVDVKIKDDVIYHYLKTELKVSEKVQGKLDFERRFLFMQNHSGEHIVSGVINKKMGFDNVGFHLNDEIVTLDFNGILNREQLDEIEFSANKKIWENNNIHAYYPTKEELKNIEFRQKKEIDGDIRIVNIENTDICACCAPHVKKTGEIGIIKLLSFEKMRGGTRIYMKCGSLALKDYQNKLLNISKIQNLLSAKPEESAQAVYNLYEKLNSEKQKVSALNKKLIGFLVENSKADENLIVAEDLEMKELQSFADMLYKKHNKTRTVLTKKDNASYSFVICGDEENAQKLFEKLKSKVKINGGGRNGMISGIVFASSEDIKGVIENI